MCSLPPCSIAWCIMPFNSGADDHRSGHDAIPDLVGREQFDSRKKKGLYFSACMGEHP